MWAAYAVKLASHHGVEALAPDRTALGHVNELRVDPERLARPPGSFARHRPITVLRLAGTRAGSAAGMSCMIDDASS